MAAGISSEQYESTEDCPLFGEGQGYGLSPPNWLFALSTLLIALNNLCVGILMFSVCRKFKAERVTDAYMDDADNTYVNEERNKEKTPITVGE
eukprot:15365826-Ditylum_brightwellii.AAC.1